MRLHENPRSLLMGSFRSASMIDAALGAATALLEFTTPHAEWIFILSIVAAFVLNVWVAGKIDIGGTTLAVVIVGAGALHFLYSLGGMTKLLEPVATFTVAAIIIGGAYKKFILDS